MRRVSLVALLAGTAAFGTVAPSPATEPGVIYPTVAGTTVIRGEGIVGITFRIPEPVRLFADDLTLEVEEGTGFAWTGISVDPEPRPFCDFCFTNFTEFYPEYDDEPAYASCYGEDGGEVGCTYAAGLHELYLVSDGAISLTIEFPGLAGSIELTATAEVDGAVQRLPVRGCDPTPDCSQGFTYGGASREVGLDGRPAFGWVIGYARGRMGPLGLSVNPGLRGIKVCAYPGLIAGSGSSGDPSDHPRGCDEDAEPAPMIGGEFVKVGDVWWRAHGAQYLGFSVWNRFLLEDAIVGFWGMWLESGMSCGSRDFHDCTRPQVPT